MPNTPSDPQPEPPKKADAAEVKKRVDICLRLILSGLRPSEILQYAAEKTDWRLQERQVRTYIKRARSEIEKLQQPKVEFAYNQAMLQLDDLLKRCINVQDYRTARSILKDKHQLQGLLKHKVEVTGADGGPIEVEDVRERRRAADAEIESWYQTQDAEAIREAG